MQEALQNIITAGIITSYQGESFRLIFLTQHIRQEDENCICHPQPQQA